MKKFLILLSIFLTINIASFAQTEDAGNIYDQVLDGKQDDGFQEPKGFDQGAPSLGTQRQPLKGRVVIAPPGSSFEVRTNTPLGSELNSIGDIVAVTVSVPLVIGNDIVVPAGSQVVGQITNVNSARRFRTGSPGSIEIRFTSLKTPDGHTFPLNAAVDETKFKLSASSTGTRVAGTAKKAVVGAGIGALGGLVGAAISGGQKGKAAAIGSGIGAGIGLGKAIVDKGEELIIPSGSVLPIKLEQALQTILPQRN